MEKYIISGFLGKGSFSNVYLGSNKLYPDKKVAIKIEELSTELNTLLHECKILLYLNGIHGIVRVHWFSKDEIKRYLVMDYYSHSLKDDIILNLPTAEKNNLYKKIWNTLKIIHSRKIIHCDIKPANIMCRIEDDCIEPYIIDFGMAHVWEKKCGECGENSAHTRENGPAFGSIRFMSISMHKGFDPCFEDDIESLNYVYFFLANRGELPWNNCNINDTILHKQIIKPKLDTIIRKIF